MTYWIVYQLFHWRGERVGRHECWGNAGDPNYSMGGISIPGEGWLMIPPDSWECV